MNKALWKIVPGIDEGGISANGYNMGIGVERRAPQWGYVTLTGVGADLGINSI